MNRHVYFTYLNKFSYRNTGNFIEPREVFGKPRFYCTYVHMPITSSNFSYLHNCYLTLTPLLYATADIISYRCPDSIPIIYSDFGQGTGLILVSNMRCSGDEANLMDCPHGGVGNHFCSHFEDAGVVCKGTCTCTCIPKRCLREMRQSNTTQLVWSRHFSIGCIWTHDTRILGNAITRQLIWSAESCIQIKNVYTWMHFDVGLNL